MMNSYLITGGNLTQRLNKAKKLVGNIDEGPDVLYLKALLSVGINQIRQLQKFLSQKPFQKDFKTALIPEAEKLTIPAQNSFLKTLEEPPALSVIILCCPNKNLLLPTIISRCQLVELPYEPELVLENKLSAEYYSLYLKIIKAGPGQRLKLIEQYTKNREAAEKFLKEMIITLNKHLVKRGKVLKSVIIINRCQKTLNLLQSNVNVKLALDNLVINLNPAPKHSRVE
ncbi:MAG TPA: hypothetical protein VMW29_03615 [Candidatus Bathyarchaeia archaeon]|nr:hypothetical protein [Candidatus Bathyarchaeia archaeon]